MPKISSSSLTAFMYCYVQHAADFFLYKGHTQLLYYIQKKTIQREI